MSGRSRSSHRPTIRCVDNAGTQHGRDGTAVCHGLSDRVVACLRLGFASFVPLAFGFAGCANVPPAVVPVVNHGPNVASSAWVFRLAPLFFPVLRDGDPAPAFAVAVGAGDTGPPSSVVVLAEVVRSRLRAHADVRSARDGLLITGDTAAESPETWLKQVRNALVSPLTESEVKAALAVVLAHPRADNDQVDELGCTGEPSITVDEARSIASASEFAQTLEVLRSNLARKDRVRIAGVGNAATLNLLRGTFEGIFSLESSSKAFRSAPLPRERTVYFHNATRIREPHVQFAWIEQGQPDALRMRARQCVAINPALGALVVGAKLERVVARTVPFGAACMFVEGRLNGRALADAGRAAATAASLVDSGNPPPETMPGYAARDVAERIAWDALAAPASVVDGLPLGTAESARVVVLRNDASMPAPRIDDASTDAEFAQVLAKPNPRVPEDSRIELGQDETWAFFGTRCPNDAPDDESAARAQLLLAAGSRVATSSTTGTTGETVLRRDLQGIVLHGPRAEGESAAAQSRRLVANFLAALGSAPQAVVGARQRAVEASARAPIGLLARWLLPAAPGMLSVFGTDASVLGTTEPALVRALHTFLQTDLVVAALVPDRSPLSLAAILAKTLPASGHCSTSLPVAPSRGIHRTNARGPTLIALPLGGDPGDPKRVDASAELLATVLQNRALPRILAGLQKSVQTTLHGQAASLTLVVELVAPSEATAEAVDRIRVLYRDLSNAGISDEDYRSGLSAYVENRRVAEREPLGRVLALARGTPAATPSREELNAWLRTHVSSENLAILIQSGLRL